MALGRHPLLCRDPTPASFQRRYQPYLPVCVSDNSQTSADLGSDAQRNPLLARGSNGPGRSATTSGIIRNLLPVVAEIVLVFSTATLTLRPLRNACLDLLAGCNASRSPGRPSLKSDCASTAPMSSRIARGCPHCAPFPAFLHFSTDKPESKTRPRQIVLLPREFTPIKAAACVSGMSAEQRARWSMILSLTTHTSRPRVYLSVPIGVLPPPPLRRQRCGRRRLAGVNCPPPSGRARSGSAPRLWRGWLRCLCRL